MALSGTRYRRYFLLCVLAVMVLLTSAAIAGSADSHVTLRVDDSTPIPSETIEFEDEEYEVDAITVRDPGTEFTAEVTLPDEEFTSVDFLLYNSDQQIEDSEGVNRPDTTETVTFETDSYAPGTYMLNVELEGATEQMQPIVIAGYDVAVDHPTDPDRDEEIDVTAEVTSTELSSAPAGVEVVVWNNSHAQTFEMTRGDGRTYTTGIPLDQFEAGDYTVNVAALGNETFRGKQEVLALENSSLTIQKPSSDDTTDDSGSGGDDGSDSDDSTSDGSDDTDGTSSDDANDTVSDSDNSSSDDDSSTETNNTTDSDPDGEATNGSDGSGTTGSNESDDTVIAPNEDPADENTDDQVSLFAVQGVFFLVIVFVNVRRLTT